jgi:hypothetical protein
VAAHTISGTVVTGDDATISLLVYASTHAVT